MVVLQISAEIWIVSDFARLNIGFYNGVGGNVGVVVEVNTWKGSGSLAFRFFQQLKDAIFSTKPLETIYNVASLQPFRAEVCVCVCLCVYVCVYLVLMMKHLDFVH